MIFLLPRICLQDLLFPKNLWDVMGCQVATCFEAVNFGVSLGGGSGVSIGGSGVS